MTTSPLAAERHALSHILSRLMDEIADLETLCKHVPRIVGVAINAARVDAALTGDSEHDDMRAIRKALADIDAETEEGTTPW